MAARRGFEASRKDMTPGTKQFTARHGAPHVSGPLNNPPRGRGLSKANKAVLAARGPGRGGAKRAFAAKLPTKPAPRTRTGKQIATPRGAGIKKKNNPRTKYAGKGALQVLGRADGRPNRAAGGTAG